MAHLLESFEADAAAVGMMTGDRAPPGVNAISKNLSVRQGYGCLMLPQCLVQSSVIRIFFYTKSYKTIKRPKTVSTFFISLSLRIFHLFIDFILYLHVYSW